jgi:hypothetical protein
MFRVMSARLRFTGGALLFVSGSTFVAGFILGLLVSTTAGGREHDAITIFAAEVCVPGKRERGCIAWMHSCMWRQMTVAGEFDWDDAGERCIELLPQDLWPD